MIRRSAAAEAGAIAAVINEAAVRYLGVIPDECWHNPYMTSSELLHEMAQGVEFSVWEEREHVVGVMGIQDVQDVTLIRHAYVRPSHQGRGIGSALLQHLIRPSQRPLLIGTWADAGWAIRFYQAHGFRLADQHQAARLLNTYWRIPERQRDASVVLLRAGDRTL